MSTGNIIKLNVGGARFQTSKSTLTKFDGFFKTMLETELPLTKDESGAIFIDRDPAHFPRILNYMRDGEIELPKNSEDVKDLQKEAQYYLLEGLVELCKLGETKILSSKNVKPKFLELKNFADEARAFVECEKRGVIIMCYGQELDRNTRIYSTIFDQIISKHGDNFDVYYEYRDKNPWTRTYYARDKITGAEKYFGIPDELDEWIERLLANN